MVHPAHLSIVAIKQSGYRLRRGDQRLPEVPRQLPRQGRLAAEVAGRSEGQPHRRARRGLDHRVDGARHAARRARRRRARSSYVYTRYQDAVPFFVENDLTPCRRDRRQRASSRTGQAKGGKVLAADTEPRRAPSVGAPTTSRSPTSEMLARRPRLRGTPTGASSPTAAGVPVPRSRQQAAAGRGRVRRPARARHASATAARAARHADDAGERRPSATICASVGGCARGGAPQGHAGPARTANQPPVNAAAEAARTAPLRRRRQGDAAGHAGGRAGESALRRHRRRRDQLVEEGERGLRRRPRTGRASRSPSTCSSSAGLSRLMFTWPIDQPAKLRSPISS